MALVQFIKYLGVKLDYIMYKNKFQVFSNGEMSFIPSLPLKKRNENSQTNNNYNLFKNIKKIPKKNTRECSIPSKKNKKAIEGTQYFPSVP